PGSLLSATPLRTRPHGRARGPSDKGRLVSRAWPGQQEPPGYQSGRCGVCPSESTDTTVVPQALIGTGRGPFSALDDAERCSEPLVAEDGVLDARFARQRLRHRNGEVV